MINIKRRENFWLKIWALVWMPSSNVLCGITNKHNLPSPPKNLNTWTLQFLFTCLCSMFYQTLTALFNYWRNECIISRTLEGINAVLSESKLAFDLQLWNSFKSWIVPHPNYTHKQMQNRNKAGNVSRKHLYWQLF